MERIVVFLLTIFLTACAAQAPAPVSRTAGAEVDAVPVILTTTGLLETRGPASAAELTEWYNSTVDDCGNPGLFAALCSGVMLRATENNPTFLPWDPSPGSITNGGVSFSWLRQDNNFAQLVFSYRNGFIFYPVLKTPPGKNSNIAVLCVFPMDANTAARPTLQGCGPNTAFPADSQPCTNLGISTASAWLARFNTGTDRYDRQCGWSVREGERDQASRFVAAIGARLGMDDAFWRVQNEVRLATWATGTGANLPIQSFFYIDGDLTARTKAQNDQLRYFQYFGQVVPIIRLTLPASKAARATFTYSEDDQADLTPSPLQFDTSPVTRAGRTFIITARMDILPPFDANNSITRVASGGQPPYTYRSSNQQVAVVTSSGHVTPRANGSATISVTDSANATAAYTITFTGIVQVSYVGHYLYSNAQSAVTGRGERLPTEGELMLLQQAFAGRWPYAAGHYWSSHPCLTGHTAFYIHTVTNVGLCSPALRAEDTVGLR
ncbi:Ig-like domain-containing protein [Luteibacter yeojuensis]|uniref:Ig-like protein group 2 n=1 Tax=Luteibacter yeojuensis TaxID=345309 RepID=A0A7X5QV90_9GAMM|nr:Ig-like domain-containing protein [Luteibacter yeojuensis]NID16031.1 hypothetical protein [Luteibacter yeojuensis]